MTGSSKPNRAGAPIHVWVMAALAAGALLMLHLRTLYVTQTASYDTLLYARSLYGIAVGEPFNPVYGTHWMAIHANLLLVPLAPLARVVEPATILAVQQALAAGWTVWLVGAGLHDHQAGRGRVVGPTLLVASSLLLVAAFTFDPRPESIAVPLGLVVFDRLARQGDWDRWSVLAALLMVMAREEFALVLAGTVVMPGLRPRGRQLAVMVSGVAGAWFVGYWFGLRPWLDAGFADDRANEAATALFGWGNGETWKYRGAVVLALLTMGGCALLRRPLWLLAAAPGVLWLLAIDKGGLDALRYHYAMLALPVLLAGVLHTRSQVRPGWLWWVPSLLQAAVTALWLLPRAADGYWITAPPQQQAIDQAHALLHEIPAADSLAAPWMLAAGEADRRMILSSETLIARLRAQLPLSDLPRWALLDASELRVARVMVGRGYVLRHRTAAMILLEQAPGATVSADLLVPWEPEDCSTPWAEFEDQGVRICRVARDESSGRVHLLVHRTAAADVERTWTWMARSREVQSPVSIMDGLVLPSQLPAGAWIEARTDQPWLTSERPEFVVVYADAVD